MATSNLVSYIRDFLHDPDGDRWSDTTVLYLLDKAQEDVVGKTNGLLQNTTVSLTEDSYSDTLPASCIKVLRFSINGTEIPIVTAEMLDGINIDYTDVRGMPTSVLLEQNTFKLYPKADQAYSLKLEYFGLPNNIDSISDTLDVKSHYEQALKFYVCGHLLRSDKDSQSIALGNDELALYSNELKYLKKLAALRFTTGSHYEMGYTNGFSVGGGGSSGSGGSATQVIEQTTINDANLSVIDKTATTLTVASSSGTNAVIPSATETEAGLMTAADKVALDSGGFTADMTKSVYDTNDNGIVDNAEKVNNLTVETAVPSGAVFTDTVYDTSAIETLTNKTIDDITNTVGADHVHYKVRNESGSLLTKGTVITADSTQPGTDYLQVVAFTDPTTQIALGILHTDLANNDTGMCTNTGVCDDFVDTSLWDEGTILYPADTGTLTDTKPTSIRYQAVAVVMRSHSTQGVLLVEFSEPTFFASTTQAGYVQLNDTLLSTSTVQALTANQGKLLKDGLDTHTALASEHIDWSVTGAEQIHADRYTDTDTIYTHPTGDGSLHVPANSTTNAGKVLTASAVAGVYTWETVPSGVTDHTLLTNIGTNTHAQIDTHIADATKHRVINDAGTLTTELFSASKIIEELGNKSDTTHDHSGVYEPADATILKDADIGVTVQAYDATIVVDADIGVTVQAYDADTTKNDVANTFTATQTILGVTETVTSKAVSFTPNLDTEGTIFKVTGTATVTMPTASAGKSFVVLDTGAFISGWGAAPAIRWKGGTIPTYTSIAYFVFECVDGTNWDGQMVGGDYATV
jgi:hypothetical protein